MRFWYLFQLLAMLIGPAVTLASIYAIYASDSLIIALVIIYLYCQGLDMWDPWKPQIIKKFLNEAKIISDTLNRLI